MAHDGKKLIGTTYQGRNGVFTLTPEQTGGKPGELHATDPATGVQGERIAVSFEPPPERIAAAAAAGARPAAAKKKTK